MKTTFAALLFTAGAMTSGAQSIYINVDPDTNLEEIVNEAISDIDLDVAFGDKKKQKDRSKYQQSTQEIQEIPLSKPGERGHSKWIHKTDRLKSRVMMVDL